MPRPLRMLIVIAVMTLIGLGVLTWMARRYATLTHAPAAGSAQK